MRRSMSRPLPKSRGIFRAILSCAVFLVASLGPAAFADSLTVSIQHNWSGTPLRFNDLTLTNAAGNTLSVTRLAYLISNISLQDKTGATTPLENQFAFIDAATGHTSFTLTNIPPGHYTNVAFDIGLESTLNHRDPAFWPAGHALNPTVNDLHWSWQGGYVFLALEGLYRRPDNQIGGFVYHLATDAIAMPVSLAADLQVPASALTLHFDVAKIFNHGAPLLISPDKGHDSTHSAHGDSLAQNLAKNVITAFSANSLHNSPAEEPPSVNTAHLAATTNPHQPTPFDLQIPASFPRPELPLDNPLTVEGVALGRKLFSETQLSRDNSQSCASCHKSGNAFADAGRALSLGVDGLPGRRNAMPLFNLLWQREFFWDGRVSRLRDQTLKPIQDPLEMHESLDHMAAKLAADADYPVLFKNAFGATNITGERVGLALEQYLFTLISADSKFDRAARSEAEFTDQEKRGLELFITEYDPARGKSGADCFHCHGGFLFSDYAYKNNGLDAEPRDLGRFLATTNAADRAKFKTPSLRNVELTAPYMHDGRFATLEEVVEHYNSGVHRSATLDPNLAKHPDTGLQLPAADKAALVAFLKTLTDEQFRAPSDSHAVAAMK
ncbi:MAG: hypothetical protein JWR26_912 [Pedosphaera sp.]|nr:hypothetical protein [Pedosphaera sp.]